MIGQWNSGARLGDWAQKDDKSGLVPKLRSLMIRHTKSQRIGGEVRPTARRNECNHAHISHRVMESVAGGAGAARVGLRDGPNGDELERAHRVRSGAAHPPHVLKPL